MITFLKKLHNEIDYPLRQFFRWRRKKLILRNEEKTFLFSEFNEKERIDLLQKTQEYISQYGLSDYYENSSCKNFRENLFYLELFETAFRCLNWEPDPDKEIAVADIGVADWFYVRSLIAFLRNYPEMSGRPVTLDGFEIDAFRVYSDAFSRIDYAMAYCRGLENVHFLAGPFVVQQEHYDVIFLLFPFIFLNNHLDWGLPAKFFSPERLLYEAWGSVKKGGVLCIVNQGAEENTHQKELFEKAGIDLTCSFVFHSDFYSYSMPRYVQCAIKPL